MEATTSHRLQRRPTPTFQVQITMVTVANRIKLPWLPWPTKAHPASAALSASVGPAPPTSASWQRSSIMTPQQLRLSAVNQVIMQINLGLAMASFNNPDPFALCNMTPTHVCDCLNVLHPKSTAAVGSTVRHRYVEWLFQALDGKLFHQFLCA